MYYNNDNDDLPLSLPLPPPANVTTNEYTSVPNSTRKGLEPCHVKKKGPNNVSGDVVWAISIFFYIFFCVICTNYHLSIIFRH